MKRRLVCLLGSALLVNLLACARKDAPPPRRTDDAILFDSAQIVLNATKLSDAVRLLGPNTITRTGGHGLVLLACYRLAGAPTAFVYLLAHVAEDAPVVAAELSRAQPEGMPNSMTCAASPRSARDLATTFGVSLGATRATVQKLLGPPSGVDQYTLNVDTSSTAVPKRLRRVFLSLTFENDSLSWVRVSKGNYLDEGSDGR